MTKHIRSDLLATAAPLETKAAEDENDDPVLAAVEGLKASATEFQTKQTDALAKLTTRIDAIDVRTQRPGASTVTTDEQAAVEKKAFTGYLRAGRESLAPDEVKTLRVGDDTAGGYLAPAEFVTEIIKGVVEFSPIRQLARVGSTASGSVTLPKRTGTPTASWVGETETRTGTESTYGQAEIPIHELACYVDVSNKLLEDAAVNVEAEVASDLAEQFGKRESIAFVSGDGNKKPVGILTDTSVAYTATGNSSTLGSAPADLLIGFLYALPATYRGRGSWLMSGSTLAAMRVKLSTVGTFANTSVSVKASARR